MISNIHYDLSRILHCDWNKKPNDQCLLVLSIHKIKNTKLKTILLTINSYHNLLYIFEVLLLKFWIKK